MKNLTELIQSEANRCVKCGLCLPHCPTYQKTQHEGESPRGRIALFDGLASGKLPLTERLLTHTDHCLSCRACEVVCPAEVEYGKLIVHGRTLIRTKKPLPFLKRLINQVVLYLPKFLPNQDQGEIILSPGCIHSWLDRKTLTDTITLLNKMGYKIKIPKKFRCCGALHAHDGQAQIAAKLARKNRQCFESVQCKQILSTATGCTPTLQQQSDKVMDINTFLNQIEWPETLSFKPLSKKVLVHAPCTLKNALRQEDQPIALLKKIPKLEVTPLKHKHCCGAAGTYFLEYPEMANSLALDIIEEIKTVSPDIFVTSNIGCAIHLKQQLKKQNIKIKVIHPVSLLLQQVNNRSSNLEKFYT